jgi:hypothetical protein
VLGVNNGEAQTQGYVVFGVKRMKSKTKDIDAEIQLVMFDQIHFMACMYNTMWIAKKEEYAW